MSAAADSPVANEEAVAELVKSIGIPPCPRLLLDVQAEVGSADPDPRRLAKIVAQDVAMSAALLKSANSAFFALKRKAETVEQAAALLGLTQCASILMGLISRRAVNAEGPTLNRYWDVSAKRSLAMARLARSMRLCAPDIAHTFGLFCDIGIPMLITRFPTYIETLDMANNDETQLFTAVEDGRHGSNHATIGAIMSRSWGLPHDLIHAIREHHNYETMNESDTPATVRNLIAMCLLSERAIQTYQNLNHHIEWEKGGGLACEILNLSSDEAMDWCEELHVTFNDA